MGMGAQENGIGIVWHFKKDTLLTGKERRNLNKVNDKKGVETIALENQHGIEV